jgi:hypothetical protein
MNAANLAGESIAVLEAGRLGSWNAIDTNRLPSVPASRLPCKGAFS